MTYLEIWATLRVAKGDVAPGEVHVDLVNALQAAIAALDGIHAVLVNGGEPWDAGTIEYVAEVITGLGYDIPDPGLPLPGAR